MADPERILVGRIGVDTGRIILCDPSYIPEQHLVERVHGRTPEQLRAISEAQTRDDAAALNLADYLFYQIPFLAGREGAAVVVYSGLGDGFYPVYATVMEIENWGERVVRLEVDFLDHPLLVTAPLEPPDGLERLLVAMVDFLEFPTDHPPSNLDALALRERVSQMLEHYRQE